MKGRRVYLGPDGGADCDADLIDLELGDYAKDSHGVFYACVPDERFEPGCFLANLANHEVIEHEDGTITVSPSILVNVPGIGQWHGYLRKGIWETLP